MAVQKVSEAMEVRGSHCYDSGVGMVWVQGSAEDVRGCGRTATHIEA